MTTGISYFLEPNEFQIKCLINEDAYEEKEQYIIYDWNSFVADVGGFLGLLLGCSALSLYNELDNVLGNLKFSLPKLG